jgi:hypothetical protein
MRCVSRTVLGEVSVTMHTTCTIIFTLNRNHHHITSVSASARSSYDHISIDHLFPRGSMDTASYYMVEDSGHNDRIVSAGRGIAQLL